jgi:hypothetical protein
MVPHIRWPHMDVPKEQHILRMMVKTPDIDVCKLPDELMWIKPALDAVANVQHISFGMHPFVYITVRSGVVKTTADGLWHVDGFSMRTPHKPEQNYIWTNSHPTEVLDQQFSIPADFDPLKHNLHTYFQDNADNSKIRLLDSGFLHIIDPYVVHRRPAVPVGTQRSFVRISFVPIEIEDDTCMHNPLLPQKFYNRIDIRKSLVSYK